MKRACLLAAVGLLYGRILLGVGAVGLTVLLARLITRKESI